MTWADVAPLARALLNAADEDTIPLQVRALRLRCWQCHRDSPAVVAVHPQGVRGPHGYLPAESRIGLSYARVLLQAAGHPAAGTIRSRFSAGEAGFKSSGCEHCGALFGASLVRDVAIGPLHDGLETLLLLATVRRPLVEWWALSCDRDDMW